MCSPGILLAWLETRRKRRAKSECCREGQMYIQSFHRWIDVWYSRIYGKVDGEIVLKAVLDRI